LDHGKLSLENMSFSAEAQRSCVIHLFWITRGAFT
jgi:hypothetical protein